MPSPAPSRQLEPAASQDSIDGLLAAPQPEVQLTNGYSESWQGQLDQLGHDFEDFFLDMFKEPNGLDSFHPQHRSLANVFCRGSPSLSYQSAAIFIKHWAATSGARLGRPLHVDSTELKVRLLQQYTKHMTGEPFDPTTFKQLIAYCRGELQVKLSLATGPPPSWIIQKDVLDQIFRSLFAPDLPVQCFRARWQMAYWICMTVATQARLGTCFKTSKRYKKEKRLVWGDITLVITKSKLTGGDNQLSHFFESPNAKRKKFWTLELDEFPVLWLDATFYLLIIAHIAGAFPNGWTYEQLLDPLEFNSRPGDCFELTFNPAKSTEAVFLGADDGTEWMKSTVGTYLDKISAHAGLEGRITPHSIRRSGAVAMKLKGATHEQIKQQLNHAVGTATFERYSGFVVSADATAAVYETTSRVAETHQHHPERVKVLPQLPDVLPALSIDERRHILTSQKMTDALLASNHALEEELKRNDVESYAELPSEAKSRYRNCYNRAQKLYRRLYRVKLTDTKAQVGSAKIREEEDGDDDDDDDDDDADEKGGHEGFAAEASVNGAVAEMETPLDRIDDFPDAEHACGDAIRAAEFLESTDLENPLTAARLMSEASRHSDPAPAESSRNAPESSTELPEPFPPIVLPSDWALDPQLQSAGVAQVGPENDATPPSDPAGAAAIPDSAAFTDFTPLLKVKEALLAEGEGDRRQIYDLCTTLSLDDTLLFGYRPGHAPVNNHCNFCGQPIPSVVSLPQRDAPDNVRDKNLIATHVYDCASMLAMYIAEDELLRKYPATTPLHPITGETAFLSSRKKVKPAEGDPFSVFDLNTLVNVSICRAKRLDQDPPTCKLDGCDQQPLFTSDYANYHLAEKHGIFLPPTTKPGTSPDPQDVQDRSFRATYYLHDSQYHCDPVETNRSAMELITTRIVEACDNVAAYGLRKDIEVDSGVLGEDDNGSLPDGKYAIRVGRSSSVVRDGLCLICVHDPELSPATRAQPFNSRQQSLYQHQVLCIATTTAETAHREGETLNRKTHLWSQDRIICPDPVCKRRDRKFGNKLDWLKHLVAVHFVQFKGPSIDRTNRVVNLDELTFANETELETWAGVKVEDDDDQAGGNGDAENGKDDVDGAQGSRRRTSKRRSTDKDEEDEEIVQVNDQGPSTRSRAGRKKARQS